MLMVVVVVVIRQQQDITANDDGPSCCCSADDKFIGRNDLLPEIGPNDSIVIHDTGYIISMTNDSGSYKV